MIARMQEHVVLERRMAYKRNLTERGRGHFGILPDCQVFGLLHDSIPDWRERAAWKRRGTVPLISGQIGISVEGRITAGQASRMMGATGCLLPVMRALGHRRPSAKGARLPHRSRIT